MAASKVILPSNVPIVDKNGNPSPFFVRQLTQLLSEKQDVAAAVAAAQATADAAVPSSALLAEFLASLGGDPNVDDLIFWDDSAGTFKFLTLGSGLSITGTTITSAGGSGAWSFKTSATVAGTPATSLTLSGLDLNADQRYFIRGSFKNATTSTAVASIYFNADQTATNYNKESLSASGTTVTGNGANDAICMGVDASNAGVGAGDTEFTAFVFKTQSGFVIADVNSFRTGNTTRLVQRIAVQWKTAGTNVTGITFLMSVASSLTVGCKLEIWKIT